jgi:hypothetical protein
MNRTLAVTRMHLTDRVTIFGLPPAILAASFLVNMLIFAAEPSDARHSGGVAAIYVVVIIAAVMATARSMAFALSMGASRRAFAQGTGLTGVLLALAFGVLLFVLNRIEVATDGWNMNAHFFSFEWLERHNPATVWLLGTALLLALFLIGAWAATIWLRWRQVGMLVGGVALVLALGGSAVLITWLHGWSAVGDWFAALTPLSATGWTALLCAALAGTSYLTLRRVTI